jgi:hypothetical protein
MSNGTLNVKSLYRSGSLTTAGRELARYQLDLVVLQAVGWNKVGSFSAGSTKENH